MKKDYTRHLGNVAQIDEERMQDHLGKVVKGTEEETLNSLLDADGDELDNAAR